MPSVGENITQAIVDALNAGDPKPATAFRTRVDALSTKELPAFIVYAVKERVEKRSENVKLRTRTVRVEAMVAGEAPADALVDPLYVYAVNTLLASNTVAALLRRIEESTIQWENEASYQDATIAFVDFEVEFPTMNDPTAAFSG